MLPGAGLIAEQRQGLGELGMRLRVPGVEGDGLLHEPGHAEGIARISLSLSSVAR